MGASAGNSSKFHPFSPRLRRAGANLAFDKETADGEGRRDGGTGGKQRGTRNAECGPKVSYEGTGRLRNVGRP